MRVAYGEPLPLPQIDLAIKGHAIEARIYAGNPAKNFQAHPERHARNGLKAALSFLLMIERRIALASLPARLAALPLAARINQDHTRLDAAHLASFVIAELEKGGAGRPAAIRFFSPGAPGQSKSPPPRGIFPDRRQSMVT